MLYNECECDLLASFRLHLESLYPKSKSAQMQVCLISCFTATFETGKKINTRNTVPLIDTFFSSLFL